MDNETGHVPQPPVLGAVVHYQMKDIVPVVQMESGVLVQPRRVVVETPGPAEQRRRAKRVAAAAADTGGDHPKGATKIQQRPAAALTIPEGDEVRSHQGWTILTRTRKSGILAGHHWNIWIATDGTTHTSRKKAEAAGFIDA